MKSIKMLGLPLLLVVIAACSNGGSNHGNLDSSNNNAPALELTYSAAPIELPGITADFAKDVRYGEGERNLFDILLPDCDSPTALVIYIHGGGFTDGDKSMAYGDAATIRQFLQACVAYATINYFLLDVPSAAEGTSSIVAQGGVLTSLQDTARALQFMRYHGDSLNIDPERVAVYGLSAGAGASLWLGTHDDMADSGNADPVLRKSTRVSAAGAIATQATYELISWEAILLPLTQRFAGVLKGTDVPTIAAAIDATNYLLTFLGVDTVDAIFTPDNEAYRANVDMLGLMDAGDAPIFVHNGVVGLGNLLNAFLHHGLHAVAVRERAVEVGLENVAYIDDPEYAFADPSGEELPSFLLRHIQ